MSTTRTLRVASLLLLAATSLHLPLVYAGDDVANKAVTSTEQKVWQGLGITFRMGFGRSGHWGARVLSVSEDSPAAQMGLEPGDVILRINGWRTWTRCGYFRALRHAGSEVRVLVDDCRGRGLVEDLCSLVSDEQLPEKDSA